MKRAYNLALFFLLVIVLRYANSDINLLTDNNSDSLLEKCNNSANELSVLYSGGISYITNLKTGISCSKITKSLNFYNGGNIQFLLRGQFNSNDGVLIEVSNDDQIVIWNKYIQNSSSKWMSYQFIIDKEINNATIYIYAATHEKIQFALQIIHFRDLSYNEYILKDNYGNVVTINDRLLHITDNKHMTTPPSTFDRQTVYSGQWPPPLYPDETIITQSPSPITTTQSQEPLDWPPWTTKPITSDQTTVSTFEPTIDLTSYSPIDTTLNWPPWTTITSLSTIATDTTTTESSSTTGTTITTTPPNTIPSTLDPGSTSTVFQPPITPGTTPPTLPTGVIPIFVGRNKNYFGFT